MAQPLVSIIIPNRNRTDFLVAALASVRGQTMGDFEAIVVDDHSDAPAVDAALEQARQDTRIRLLHRQGDRGGAAVCRNQGVQSAGADLVVFLDSDDALAPHALAQRVQALTDHADDALAVFPCRLFRSVPGDMDLLWNAPTDESDLDRLLKMDVPWQTTGPIWRRKALDAVGPWDESLPSWQDWDYHVRALIAGLRYRKHDTADCFWRVPDQSRGSVGLRAASPGHIVQHERLLDRTATRLDAAGLLTPQRRAMLAGLYMLVALNWLKPPSRPGRALALWRTCRRGGHVDAATYIRGCAHLAIGRGWTGRRLERLLGQDWSGAGVPQALPPQNRDVRAVATAQGAEQTLTPGGPANA
jgi:hypothetical protein